MLTCVLTQIASPVHQVNVPGAFHARPGFASLAPPDLPPAWSPAHLAALPLSSTAGRSSEAPGATTGHGESEEKSSYNNNDNAL